MDVSHAKSLSIPDDRGQDLSATETAQYGKLVKRGKMEAKYKDLSHAPVKYGSFMALFGQASPLRNVGLG